MFGLFKQARTRVLRKTAKRQRKMGNEELAAKAESYIHDDKSPMFFVRLQSKKWRSLLEPISPSSISSSVRTVTRNVLGKENERGPHSMRHAKVFRLLVQDGWERYNVKQYMGHESIDTTLKYVALGWEEQAKDFDRKNGNGGTAQVAPDIPSLTKVLRQLKELREVGVLTAEEFSIKVDEAAEKYS